MSMRRIAPVAAALALVLGLAACSNNETETNVGQASETVTVTSPTAVQTETTSPTTSPSTTFGGDTPVYTEDGTLPAGFPESVPIPDGAEPVYSFGGSDGYSVWFSSDKSLDDLRSFFGSSLPDNGWTIENRIDGSSETGIYTVYLIRGNGFNGGVYLGEGVEGSDTFTGEYAFYVLLNRE